MALLSATGREKERKKYMTSYDSWLSKQADAYWEPCEPEMDRYGEYTKCIECFEKCEQYYEIFGEENDTRDE